MFKGTIIFFLVLSFSLHVCGQSRSGVELARWHAGIMQDSLGLPDSARMAILSVNNDLFSRKRQAWLDFANDSSNLQHAVQVIENTRDSLYRNILSTDKYLLYLVKKPTLIRAN